MALTDEEREEWGRKYMGAPAQPTPSEIPISGRPEPSAPSGQPEREELAPTDHLSRKELEAYNRTLQAMVNALDADLARAEQRAGDLAAAAEKVLEARDAYSETSSPSGDEFDALMEAMDDLDSLFTAQSRPAEPQEGSGG